MRELDRVFGRRWGVVLVGLLAGACVGGGDGGDADGGKTNQSCEDGEEGCACYGNGTCDKGLSCLSRLCVNTEGDKDDDEVEADASSAPAAERDAEADDAPSKPAKDDANDETTASDAENDDATSDDAPPNDDAPPEPSDDSSSEPEADDVVPVETSDEPSDDGPSDASVGESSDETTSEPSSDDTGADEPVSDDTETSDATTDDDTDPPPPPPMGELIVNGDFQDGIVGWNIETTTATPDTSGGALCLRPLVEYDYVYGPVGWPLDPLDGFALESGATYEFSFDAYITSAEGSVVEFEAKVGEADTPYTPVFTWTPAVSSEPTRFAAQFVSDYSFDHAGIVFTIYTTIDVCIGHVSMTRVD